jgi:hypothetical protein
MRHRVYSNSRTAFADPRSQSEQTYKACQGAQWGVLLFLARVLSDFFDKQKAEVSAYLSITDSRSIA